MRDLILLFKKVRQEFALSDLQTSYSFLYVWMANQFGHVFIGFGGTLLLIMLVISLLVPFVGDNLFPAIAGILSAIIAIAWLLLWYAKEYYIDICGGRHDLEKALGARHKGSDAPCRDASDSAFLRDVSKDSWVDGWFYTAGVLLVVVFSVGSWFVIQDEGTWAGLRTMVIGIAVLLVLSVGISRSWLWQKIAFDQASLPFLSRFALLDSVCDPALRGSMYKFATKREEPGNMLIVGPAESGRSTLAVALAVEAILRTKVPVSYTTLVKLLDQIDPAQDRSSQSASITERRKRRLEEASLLIVDDIGASFAGGKTVNPAELDGLLSAQSFLRDYCLYRRVIWVIGDNRGNARQWVQVIEKHFKGDPICVELSPIPPQERKVGR